MSVEWGLIYGGRGMWGAYKRGEERDFYDENTVFSKIQNERSFSNYRMQKKFTSFEIR